MGWRLGLFVVMPGVACRHCRRSFNTLLGHNNSAVFFHLFGLVVTLEPISFVCLLGNSPELHVSCCVALVLEARLICRSSDFKNGSAIG